MGSVLLRLRLPPTGVCHTRHHCGRDYHPLQLLSTVWGELSLVVALLHYGWVNWILRLSLLLCVLQAIGGQFLCYVRALLRVHGFVFSRTILNDWICGCHVVSYFQ